MRKSLTKDRRLTSINIQYDGIFSSTSENNQSIKELTVKDGG